ncbi:MAG TPA: hypothetical protein VLV83_05840 [Acidobacteriota bacterium]|nr:hypothetical protein [Acidobacteriota bacterium]
MITKSLLRVGWAPAAVLLTHTSYIALFGHPPELDLVMHVLGGLAIAYAVHSATPLLRDVLGTLRLEAHCLLVLGLSFVIAVSWEYAEFAGDWINDVAFQASRRDTIFDLLLGTSSALLFTILIYVRGKLRQSSS